LVLLAAISRLSAAAASASFLASGCGGCLALLLDAAAAEDEAVAAGLTALHTHNGNSNSRLQLGCSSVLASVTPYTQSHGLLQGRQVANPAVLPQGRANALSPNPTQLSSMLSS
jgi:hypothetical protein